MRIILPVFILCLTIACTPTQETTTEDVPVTESIQKNFQGFSLMGDSLFSSPPGEAVLARFEEKKAAYLADPNKVENLIWYGRFTAYIGNYREAIQIYTDGIKQFPEDARLYRHRGHRHLTIRQYDEAVADFEKAAELIAGTENEVEPDGMPNAQNIPVSTLHGNIYYHLGLAYYLKQDMENALTAYQKCLASSGNNDNLVSSTHWLYMISRRLGREEEANTYLAPINKDLDVIENMAYHTACLFYKGEMEEAALLNPDGDAPANDAIAYALANWSFYNDNLQTAKERYETMLSSSSWNSFGYLAAEADYYAHFVEGGTAQ